MGWRCAWRRCIWSTGGRRFRWRVEGWAVGWGSAGSVLRSQVSSGEDELLRCAQGFCGSLPMLAPARSRCRLVGGWCGRGVRLSAFGFGCFLRGFWVFRGGLRCGSGDGVGCRGGLCGIDPALAGKLGGRISFCAARRVFVDRFQCSLRTDPAAAYWGRRVNQMQMWLGRRRFRVQPFYPFP